MKQSDRKTLKGYFKAGSVPSSRHFCELIDSVPNIVDDGDPRSKDDGLALHPHGKNSALLEVYASDIDKNPSWSLILDANKNMQLVGTDGKVVFSTGVDVKKQSSDSNSIEVLADGNWHNLPIQMQKEGFNCGKYRVLAYYQSPTSLKYKFVKAVVSHRNGKKTKIKSSRKCCCMWFSRMKLRWKVINGELCLQIRSKRRMDATNIQCNIKRLWDCSYGR